MSSQLGAAEHLSESLSKQMAMLSIEQPSVKKQNVKRELFEAVGIPYNVASFSSPDEKRAGGGTNNKLLTSLCSDAVRGQSRRNQSSAMKGCESEMTRRRQDSLDPVTFHWFWFLIILTEISYVFCNLTWPLNISRSK